MGQQQRLSHPELCFVNIQTHLEGENINSTAAKAEGFLAPQNQLPRQVSAQGSAHNSCCSCGAQGQRTQPTLAAELGTIAYLALDLQA